MTGRGSGLTLRTKGRGAAATADGVGPISRILRRFFVSIVRVGLAETKNFAEGYEAIFGGKKKEGGAKKAKPVAKKGGAKKKAKKK
jgi:hypothetical protein